MHLSGMKFIKCMADLRCKRRADVIFWPGVSSIAGGLGYGMHLPPLAQGIHLAPGAKGFRA